MFSHIKLARYELTLVAGKEGLMLPPYKGSTLRGGFGKAFQRVVCSQKDRECRQCLLKNTCPYSYIFETAPPPGGQILRKYENIPRPFILEPPLETKTLYRPGDQLVFQLVLLGKAINYLPYFIVVFRELGQMGIGKGRKEFQLNKVNAVNLLTGEKPVIYHGAEGMVTNLDVTASAAELVDSTAVILPEDRPLPLTIRFHTMTRLKYEQEFTAVPEFHIIIRNLLRRLSSISYFHHGIELQLDFQGLIEKAREVSLVSCRTRWANWERYSSRQDARMNMGGIVGDVVYEGNWMEFWPLLKLAEEVHVGKGAVFGLGKVELIPGA